MVTTLASKPNHYERLGLNPGAGDAEIARAFATAMSPLMPRSVRDIAEIGVAFETLRDPVRRRAYDESIAPPPRPQEPLREPDIEQAHGVMFPRDGWPIIASARIGSAELPAVESLRRPSVKPEPEVQGKPQAEPRPALREAAGFDEDERANWRRPAITLGGLFLGVAAVGAGLGWYASRGMSAAQAEQPVTMRVQRTQQPPAEVAPPSAAPVRATEIAPQSGAPPRVAEKGAPSLKTLRHRSAAAPQAVSAEPRRAEDVPDIPSEQGAALASSATEPSEAMPLPDAVVARTIGRIGYACGEVASTTAVEGAPGAFKITCTSGQSYRAAPVRGRYHFKRWRD